MPKKRGKRKTATVHDDTATASQPVHHQSTPMDGDILNLNWRDAPNTAEIEFRLQDLLNRADASGYVKLIASSGLSASQYASLGKGKKDRRCTRGSQLKRFTAAGCLVTNPNTTPERKDEFRAWIYQVHTSIRRQQPLFGIALVVSKMVRNLDRLRSEERRNCGYDLASQSFPKAKGLRFYQDLALTIGVHPSACGVHPAGNGLFLVPTGYRLIMDVCEDVCAYLNSRHISNTRPEGIREVEIKERTTQIEAMILSLKIKKTSDCEAGNKPRAVIVTEHRNMNEFFSYLQKGAPKADWTGIFVVMTGGMPSLSTREFLHLLAKDEMLADVPFLFVSDRDLHAFEIHNVLKVGARATSYAYQSTICPRLKWAGVSMKSYSRLAVAWPKWELSRRVQSGECDENNQEKEYEKIVKQRDRQLYRPLQLERAKLNKTDRMLMAHFYQYGVVSPVHDEELYEDLISMGMNSRPGEDSAVRDDAPGMKFPLAKMGSSMAYGLENLFLLVLQQNGVNVENSEMPLPDLSQARLEKLAQGTAFEPLIGSSQPAPSSGLRYLSEIRSENAQGVSSGHLQDSEAINAVMDDIVAMV